MTTTLTCKSLISCDPTRQYYNNPTTKTRGISLFYKLLNDKEVVRKKSSVLAWKKELGISFTLDQWQMALFTSYAATKCVNLWELSHKILLWWYLTPYRIAKFAPQASASCWRNCAGVGTLFHTLWSCPVIYGLLDGGVSTDFRGPEGECALVTRPSIAITFH